MTRTPSSSSSSLSFSPASSPSSASALFGPLTPLAWPLRLLLFADQATILDDEEGDFLLLTNMEAEGGLSKELPPLVLELEFPEDWSPLPLPDLEFPEGWSPLPLPDLNQGEEVEEQAAEGEVEGEAEGEEQAAEGGEEGEEEGEEGQVSEDASVEAPEEPVSAQAGYSAARALKISLKALTELPQQEWEPAVQTAFKQGQLDSHPDKGGTQESFIFLRE